MPFGNPLFTEIVVQVSPPSVLLYIPEPFPPEDKLEGVLLTSQVVAYKIRGLFGSKIKSMAPEFSSANNTFFQFSPPSMDLYTPLS